MGENLHHFKHLMQRCENYYTQRRWINTYPIGKTSSKMNLSLSRATSSSSKPIYSHIMALVGRIAQVSAAIAKPNFLDMKGSLPEAGLKQGQ